MKKKTAQKASPKVIRRFIRRRDAVEAASRLRMKPDGSRFVIRFSIGQRVQHWILLFSFTLLGLTGLAQSFYNTPVGNLILVSLGGISAARQVHHIAAFVFSAEAIYHIGRFIYDLYIYHKIGKIWPGWSDLTDLIQKLSFNLGMSNRHPAFDRYNFEEKAEYWALIWGGIIMGATGLIQWFPIQVTFLVPGWVVPVARALHQWEAILAVLAILTWHFYHTLIKTRNFSIFDGVMTIEQMEEEHPLELAYLERAATVIDSDVWPVLIEIPLEEPEKEEPAQEPDIDHTETVPPIPVDAPLSEVEDTANEHSVETVEPPTEADSPLNIVEEISVDARQEVIPSVATDALINETLPTGES